MSRANKEDYYSLLQVAKNSSADEIKRSYRKLAMKYHPDRNQGNEEAQETFKQIAEAYAVLSDPSKREQYDRYGHAAFDQASAFDASAFRNFGGGGGGFGSIFEDLFDMFGSGGTSGRAQRRRGDDLRHDLEVTLEQAFNGDKIEIDAARMARCASCGGSGEAEGKSRRMCASCGGTGKSTYAQGFFAITRTCNICHGEGYIITNPCKECKGSGQTVHKRKLKVTIPPGISDGSRLRIEGEGSEIPDGEPGDLYIFVSVKPHELYHRDGNDLWVEKAITFPQAALGAEIEIPTLNGPVKMKIKPGTQSGSIYLLKEKGMPVLGRFNRFGDFKVKIIVMVPTKLTSRQEELTRQLASEMSSEVMPARKSIFQKVMQHIIP